MRNVEVRVLNNNAINDIREAALNTVGKELNEVKSEMKEHVLLKYMISEHSPIRAAMLRITMYDIEYPTSVHFCRHVHSIPYVTTSRPDRTGKERDIKNLVVHKTDINAQALIDMARKRLCIGSCSKDTYTWMKAIKEYMLKSDDIILYTISNVLVPNCVYRSGCPEFKPCNLINKACPDMQYDILHKYNQYNEWFSNVRV